MAFAIFMNRAVTETTHNLVVDGEPDAAWGHAIPWAEVARVLAEVGRVAEWEEEWEEEWDGNSLPQPQPTQRLLKHNNLQESLRNRSRVVTLSDPVSQSFQRWVQ